MKNKKKTAVSIKRMRKMIKTLLDNIDELNKNRPEYEGDFAV